MTTEATGIGAIALALIGILTKMWADSTSTHRRVIDVVEKNAIAMTLLNESIRTNTKVTEEVGNVTKANTFVNTNLAQRIEDVLARHNN